MSPIVLVTARWGESQGEPGLALRLLAGALSPRAPVEVIALRTAGPEIPGGAPRSHRDGAFVVHEVAASQAEPVRESIVRAALARDRSGRLPDVAGPQLLELAGGRCRGVPELIASLDPDSVVLAGPETWWLPDGLRSIGATSRVVALPLLGDDPVRHVPQLRPLLQEVDGLGVLSRSEARHVSRLAGDAPDRPAPNGLTEVCELDVALSVDGSAAESKLFEMDGSGPYVVLMGGYPAGTPGARRTPGHDYVRALLGPIAVAEVAFDRWSVSDGRKTLELTAAPSRVNLWRLLRHAEVCLDLRPAGIVGRETIEALLLGTPVVVPEGTAAAEHAERSNGGLWYRDYLELFEGAKAILDDPALRAALGRQGREWAVAVHGDQGRFCEQAARLVLG